MWTTGAAERPATPPPIYSVVAGDSRGGEPGAWRRRNGYVISVPSVQTPGGNIEQNLSGFRGLRVLNGNGADPAAAAQRIAEAVTAIRTGAGPVLLRLLVPRLGEAHVFDTSLSEEGKKKKRAGHCE